MGHSRDPVEPVPRGEFESLNIEAGDVTALVLGSPDGWQSLLDRLWELMEDGHPSTWAAILFALSGDPDEQHWERQIDLHRRAVEEVTIARLAGPTDDVIVNRARLLVQLVKLTPRGFRELRDRDPDEALAVLVEGDQLVSSMTKEAERRRQLGEDGLLRPDKPFDDLEPIDPAKALDVSKREK